MSTDRVLSAAPEISQRPQDNVWETKQRQREYRVAARREKRNRKADEKKQRKLNATILRRMTRNPDKYNKNAGRNRLRDIEGERRKIWAEAVRQARCLAAIHDPTGISFNVEPIVKQQDGSVISLEHTWKKEGKQAGAKAMKEAEVNGTDNVKYATSETYDSAHARNVNGSFESLINPEHLARMDVGKPNQAHQRMSKTQQRKIAALAPRPPPPKPVIPEGISLPEGEEDWLAMWNLSDDQLERRVIRAKKRKAANRKALRVQQKAGKVERRAARDEKRKVYRDIKLTWKTIKEEQTRHKTNLKSLEDEESKRLAVEINRFQRKVALDFCAKLGFTLDNTPGVDEIKPKAPKMKGVEVNFDAIEAQNDSKKAVTKRVNLGGVLDDSKVHRIAIDQSPNTNTEEEFIQLDVGEGQDYEAINFNRKLRRKLGRAIDNAKLRKEMLVRQRVLDYCTENHSVPPTELKTPLKAVNVRGQRILEKGQVETAKQERVRMRMELVEYNEAARVLRSQAKRRATESGLLIFAQLTGKISQVGLSANALSQAEPGPSAADVLSALEDSLTTNAVEGESGQQTRRRLVHERSEAEGRGLYRHQVESPDNSTQSEDSLADSNCEKPRRKRCRR